MSSTTSSSCSTSYTEPIYHDLYYPRPKSKPLDTLAQCSSTEDTLLTTTASITSSATNIAQQNLCESSRHVSAYSLPDNISAMPPFLSDIPSPTLNPTISLDVNNDPNFVQYSATAQFTSLDQPTNAVHPSQLAPSGFFMENFPTDEPINSKGAYEDRLHGAATSSCDLDTLSSEGPKDLTNLEFPISKTNFETPTLIDYRTKKKESNDPLKRTSKIEDVYRSWTKKEHIQNYFSSNSSDSDFTGITNARRKFSKLKDSSSSYESLQFGIDLSQTIDAYDRRHAPSYNDRHEASVANSLASYFDRTSQSSSLYTSSDCFNHSRQSDNNRSQHSNGRGDSSQTQSSGHMQHSIDFFKHEPFEQNLEHNTLTASNFLEKDIKIEDKLDFRMSFDEPNYSVPYNTSHHVFSNISSNFNPSSHSSTNDQGCVDLRTSLLHAKEEARKSGSQIEEEFLDEWMRCLNKEDNPAGDHKPLIGQSFGMENSKPPPQDINTCFPSNLNLNESQNQSFNFTPAVASPMNSNFFESFNAQQPNCSSLSAQASSSSVPPLLDCFKPSPSFDGQVASLEAQYPPRLLHPVSNNPDSLFPMSNYDSQPLPAGLCDVTAEVLDMSMSSEDPQLSGIMRTGWLKVDEKIPLSIRTGPNKRR